MPLLLSDPPTLHSHLLEKEEHQWDGASNWSEVLFECAAAPRSGVSFEVTHHASCLIKSSDDV